MLKEGKVKASPNYFIRLQGIFVQYPNCHAISFNLDNLLS